MTDNSLLGDRFVSKVVLSIFAGVGAFTGSYAVAGGTRGYLLEPFASLLTRYTPPVVFQYLRSELGSTLQGFMATALAVGAVAVIVFVSLWIAGRIDRPRVGSPVAGVGAIAVTAVSTGTVAPAIGAGVAAALVVGVGELAAGWPSLPPAKNDRRRFLGGLVTAGGIAVFGRAIGDLEFESSGTERELLAERGTKLEGVDQDAIESLLGSAASRSLDIDGIEPLVSDDFYTVDINQVDPDVIAGLWSLSITGAVDTERTVDYLTIRDMEPEHRFVTLRCVSDEVNGHAIDNALWTGVPFSKVLDETTPGGEYVKLHASDGYSVGFPLAAIEDGFLAYGMNGKVLPRAHGFPLRALVPGHWGETNAKWLTEIEITEELEDGYWESRGWEGTGPVHTVAKIHTVNRRADGRIEVGGPAYAGTRGISGVEVSTDAGNTWQSAELSERLPGDDVWRQWRYEYDAPGQKHAVYARAIEADGSVQPDELQEPYPEGPTGYANRTLEP
ncbi:MAG: hypothetical protein ACI9PP_001661 [Halobacteriales archaeon]|jgi:hypothetical protein